MKRRSHLIFVLLSSALVTTLLVGTVLGRSATSDGAYKQLSVFAEVLSRIKSDYVEEPDLKGVTAGAINGLLESIDPYASYLSADQYKQYLASKDQKKPDVGLILSKRYGYIGVVDAIPGSPAAKAGLNTGDMVESIKEVSTRDMPLAYADLLLKGEAGTSIELTVLRVRQPESQKITLVRANYKLPAVQSTLLPDETAWIAVQSMETGKVKEIARAVESMTKQGAKRIVLDLRDSALGVPEDGIALANLFLDKGTIGTLSGQRVTKQTFEAEPSKQITKLPLALITNRGTAGAAEVAAAALLDNKRAEIVGERTYGDAASRKAITMDDGSAIILAVAKFHSPSGKAIQDSAVTPSVPMSDQQEDTDSEDEDVAPTQPAEPQPRTAEDPLLKKAIDVLVNGVPKDAQKAPVPGTPRPEPDKPATPLGVPKPNN